MHFFGNMPPPRVKFNHKIIVQLHFAMLEKSFQMSTVIEGYLGQVLYVER
jgi:hypothetical protein